MKKHLIKFTLLSLLSFFCFCHLFASPNMRDGWPYLISEYWSTQLLNQLVVYKHSEAGWIIGVASNGIITFLDLNGNELDGWPLRYERVNMDSTGAILQGPRLGDMNGDGNPEIAFRTQVSVPFVSNLEVYSFSGERLNNICVIDTALDYEGKVLSCPVFVDLDGNGTDELIRIYGNAIHAQQYDGSEHPGFPISIGEYINQFNYGVVVGAGDGWQHDYNVVLWSTQDHVHAQRIGEDEELPGWPIEVQTPTVFSAPSMIATDEGWILTIHCQNTLYAWDQDGVMLDGFPIRNIDTPHTSLAFACYLTISDVDGDNQPEIIYRNNDDDLNVFTLQGVECRGFPLSFYYQALNEQPVVMYEADSDSAYIHVGSMIQSRFIVSTAYHYSRVVQDYETRFLLGPDQIIYTKTNTALIPPENDTLYVVSYNCYPEYGVRVYEIPMEGDGTHIEWQMPGNNAGGNRLYCPRHYLGVNEPEDTNIPETFLFNSVHPNPFNPSTTFTFTIQERGVVDLQVYNLLGEKVATLLDNKHIDAGKHQISWDTLQDNLSTGIYFAVLSTENARAIQKCVLLK